MRLKLILLLFLISISGYSQIRLSDLNVKSSVSGTEKIPVSGSGNPAVTPNLLRTEVFGLDVAVTTSATAITLTDADTDKFYKCSNATLLTVTLPNGLKNGHRTKWLKLGAGNIRFVAAGTYEGTSDEIQIADGVAQVVHTGSNVWSGTGTLGGAMYAFDTFIPISGSNVVATASSETVTLASASGNKVSISGNSGTNTLTFDVAEENLTMYRTGDKANYWFEDFETDVSALGGGKWTEVVSSGDVLGGQTFGVDATENADGVMAATTTTSATGRGALVSGTANALMGNGVTRRLGWRSAISHVSDGTETFTTYCGYFDQAGAGDCADGVYFRYTHSVNSGKIQAVTKSNFVETAADTGITPTAGQFYRFEVRVNSAGNSATYYIDDSLVATITTNIPSGAGRQSGIVFKIEKSAGTTARLMYIDWVEHEKVRTTNR